MKLAIILGALFALVVNSHGVPFQGRIIDGEYTTIEDVPYQVALLWQEEQLCGGSMISEYWVLTAAHCVVDEDQNLLSIVVGTTKWASGGSRHKVSKVIAHPQYNKEIQFDYDYAVILVQDPFPVGSAAVKPIRLADTDPSDGTTVIISGWGDDWWRTESLKKASLPFVSRERCGQLYDQMAQITDRMVCAGWPEGGNNTCYGDSGGPLVVNGTQVGIVSFARGCALAHFPTVFASVANQRSWIREQSGV